MQDWKMTDENAGYSRTGLPTAAVQYLVHNVSPVKRDMSPPVYQMLFSRRTPLITVMK